MTYFVYILHSQLRDKYYVGHTNDTKRRVVEHNENPRTTFTSKYRPWILSAEIQIGENRGDAIKVERYIKKQKSKRFIKSIVENKENTEFIARLVRVPFERD